MGTIYTSDTIFATIRQRGCVLTTMRLSGISSFADILARLRGNVHGMATIELRNGTQGWAHRRTVMLCA